MGPPLRSFADDAHDCIMVPDPQGSYRIQGCYGANAPPRQASSPLIRSAVVNLRATSETALAPSANGVRGGAAGQCNRTRAPRPKVAVCPTYGSAGPGCSV